MKDWTGNQNSIFKTLGASNHTEDERQEHDYYATEPKAVEILLENETFNHSIWECACGEGYISKVLQAAGYDVYSSDLIYRGFGDPESFDFLEDTLEDFEGDIITNPPYKFAKEFVERAIDSVQVGCKVAMLLKLTFLEGAKRKELFDKYPPKKIYVFRNRIDCWKNGEEPDKPSKAVCYAWFVWEKGFKGDPIIKWIN